MIQDLGPYLEEVTDRLEETNDFLKGIIVYARVRDEDDLGVYVTTGWSDEATDDQLHAAMVSLIEDITGNDRLQGLFLEALQTHFGELDDTSGRRS